MRVRRGLSAAFIALALVATVPAVPAVGAIGDDCPAIRPLEEISVGDRGTGLTVERGTEPVTFDVTVVGTLVNALGPGRHLLLVEASGTVIERAGGIWSGMSGSPIYIGGELVGALSYGFSGSSRIAGVTPAEDLVAVGASSVTLAPSSIRVPQAVAAELSEKSSLAPTAGDSRMEPLLIPVVVSGLGASRIDHLREVAEQRDAPWFPVAGGGRAAMALETTTVRPQPGDNLGAGLATGDVYAYAAGTLSYVCGDRAVGFGHSFFWSGDTSLSANAGEAFAVIADPVFGPYKQMSLSSTWGTIDQDRMAGVGGVIGTFPHVTPVTSTVRDVRTGRARNGATNITFGELLPDLALTHIVANMDVVTDRVGPGQARVDARVTGVRSDGTPWTYQRSNRFADHYDISFGTIWELYGDLIALQNQPLDEVEITAIHTDVAVDPTYAADTIGTPEVSLDGGDTFAPVEFELFLMGGQTLVVRVPLRATVGRDVQIVAVELPVPDGVSGFGSLNIRSGPGFFDPWSCVYDPTMCAGDNETFDEFLEELQQRPRNDELVVALELYPEGVPVPSPDGAAGEEPTAGLALQNGGTIEPLRVEAVVPLERVAIGEQYIPIYVQPSGSDIPGGEGVDRLAGDDRIATAIAVSQADMAFGAPTVVLARADDPADAITAVPLARKLGAPVLLTSRTELPRAVADEISRLGATEAIIVGGVGAVGSAVEDGLVDAGVTRVQRLAGADRTSTARRTALRLGTTSAVLVDSRAWPDAVSSAALAGMQGRAVLMAEGGTLPDATREAIEDLGITEVTLVGGTAVLPRALEDALDDLGVTVDRLAGLDRVATARAVADRAVESGADPTRLVVASARSFADALVASSSASARFAPLLLIDGDDARVVLDWIGQWGTQHVTIVGGPDAVSASVETALADAVANAEIPPPPEFMG